MELTDKNDFGDGCHMAITAPFFYDSAYKLVKKEYALPIDTNGRCITAKNGAHTMKFQDIQLKSGSAQVNVKFLVIVVYVRLLTLTSSLLVVFGFF